MPARTAGETREKLIASARRLFAQSRYESVKVSDIVAAAGVSQGTFYYHFADKEGVLVQILEDFFAKGRALGEAWAGTEDAGSDAIGSFAWSVAAFIYDNQDIMRIMDGEAIGLDHRVASVINAFYRDLYDQVARAIELGMRLGSVRPCDARIAAVSHVGMIKEVIRDQLDREPGGVDLEHVVSELLELVYFGVRPASFKGG